MACGQNDAVSVSPCGGAGSVSEDVVPERVGGGCEAHRSAWVSTVGLFNSVDG